MTKNPAVLGNYSDISQVFSILQKIDMDFSDITIVSDGKTEVKREKTDSMIAVKSNPISKYCLSYSMVDNSADVVLINLQKRENSISFEILMGNEMDRIFIGDDKSIRPESALIASTLMIKKGIAFEKVIKKLNDILK
ncbi:MAG: hypothetical protein ACI4QE_01085 [Acutalibacteraceae bacterium]